MNEIRGKIKSLGIRKLDLAVLALVTFSGLFLILNTVSAPSAFVSVMAAGKTYEFDLSDDGIHEVEGVLGLTKFEIKEGRVRILDSPCPNKTCISQGFSDSIICLPNRVSIQVVCSQFSDFSDSKVSDSKNVNSTEEFDVISK